jgi:hypothetical protein
MGLLDDAIRDHLELKRLRGADPGEVAREQREALEPGADGGLLANEEAQTAVESLDAEDNHQTIDVHASQAVTPTSTAEELRAPEPAHAPDSSSLAEETAELDMRSVLDEDGDRAAEDGSDARAPGAGPEEVSASFDDLNEDQLEWELPGAPRDAGHDDHALGGDSG